VVPKHFRIWHPIRGSHQIRDPIRKSFGYLASYVSIISIQETFSFFSILFLFFIYQHMSDNVELRHTFLLLLASEERYLPPRYKWVQANISFYIANISLPPHLMQVNVHYPSFPSTWTTFSFLKPPSISLERLQWAFFSRFDLRNAPIGPSSIQCMLDSMK
jgi:hypothetical protein